jgi:hypothetical protein
MYNPNQYTIDTINDIIDDYVTNEQYEERGHNFMSEEYDHLVFSVTNNAGWSNFEGILEELVQSIEYRARVVVFDYYPAGSRDTWIIETSKD